jgi:hypothetical protein
MRLIDDNGEEFFGQPTQASAGTLHQPTPSTPES